MRAILFDLDDTLIVDEAASREAFADTAEEAKRRAEVDPKRFAADAMAIASAGWKDGPAHRYCRAIGISAYECLWGDFSGDAHDLRVLQEWSKGFRPRVFDQALRMQGIESDETGADLAACFEEARWKRLRLMPNAKETVAQLATQFDLGLLTNGAPAFQRAKFAASGLKEFFKASVVSGEEGIGKPSPEIFARLLSRLDVEAEDAVMIGNSMERDIAGAKAAGITSIWIEVPGAEEPEGVSPDFTVQDLSELPAIIASLPNASLTR